MEASGLVSPGIPQLFPAGLREIPATLNEDLLYLYGRSGQVLANTFAFLNHSESLAADFDWELHESPGWRRELHSFDYALDLGMTYRISQQAPYAIHLRYLIAHWIAANPPGQTSGWEPEPLARRIRNWILAASLARSNWEGDAQFLELLGRSLAMQSVFLGWHALSSASPEDAARAARSLLLASKYFGAARAEGLAEKGRAALEEALRAALASDETFSVPRPSSLLQIAEASVENLIFSPPLEDSGRELEMEKARRVLTILEGALMPDGTLPLFGPSANACVDGLSDLFSAAAVLLEEPAWKNLAGKFGIMPYLLLGERSKLRFEQMPEKPWNAGARALPELGLYRLSSTGRSAMMINARPGGLYDKHEDYLSYELSLERHRVVVDSGAYSPRGETWDKYFSSARAHNVLLIDGHSARPALAVVRETSGAPESADADGVSRLSGQGICFEDYGFDFLGVRRHRAFYLLAQGSWAVLDRLAGAGRRRVSSLIHFFPTFEIEAREDRAVIRSRVMTLTVVPLGSPPPLMRTWRGLESHLHGFYSPDFGVKFAAGALALEAHPATLPWIGGYLLLPGAQTDLSAARADPEKGSVEFELAGKPYRLVAP